jgi:hypothetical protein
MLHYALCDVSIFVDIKLEELGLAWRCSVHDLIKGT